MSALDPREPPARRDLRELLEREIGAPLAHAVLVEATAPLGGRVPPDPGLLAAFVRGPLLAAVREIAGPSPAARVTARAEEFLARTRVSGPGGSSRSGLAARGEDRISAPPSVNEVMTTARYAAVSGETPVAWPTNHPTASIAAMEGAVGVLVVSASPSLAERLRSFVEPDGIVVTTEADPDVARTAALAEPPFALVVVDVADLAVDPAAVLELMRALPPTTARAVWGSEGKAGARLLAALEERGRACYGFRSRTGLELLVDVARAHAGGNRGDAIS